MTSKQVLMGGDSEPYRSEARYYRAFNFDTKYYSAGSEEYIRLYFPIAGTISGISAVLDNAPGGATKSWTLTLRKNAVNTVLTVTIIGTTAKTGSAGGAVDIAAGDYVTLLITPANTPATTPIKWSFDWIPDTEGSELIMTSNGYSADQTNDRYNFITGSEVGAAWVAVASEATRRLVVPCAGRLKTMLVHLNNAPLVGASWDFTVLKNGVATSLTVQVADNNKDATDPTHYVDLVAGDELSLLCHPTNLPNPFTREAFSFEFVPATQFETPVVAGGPYNNMTPGANNFIPITQANSWSSTEAGRDVTARTTRFTRIYVKLGAQPGSGKSWTFALRINGINSALSVTISDASTSGYTDASVDINTYDKLIVIATSSGGPAATTAEVSLVQFYSAVTNASVALPAHFLIPQGSANLQAGFVVRQVASRDLQAGFIVAQDSEDLLAAMKVRQTALLDLKVSLEIKNGSSTNLKAVFVVQPCAELFATFRVHKYYDFAGALGLGFYWWGSGIIEGDQDIDFMLLTPTGGWTAKFPDGDEEWRWILLPFEDRDPTSPQRLKEIDLGGSHADKSHVDSFLWTYYSKGVRRVAYIIIWYGGDLPAEFIVRHPSSAGLQCGFKVRHTSSNDLQSAFTVNP